MIPLAESSQRVQRRRHGDDLIAHPAIVSITRRAAIRRLQLTRDYIRFLLWRTVNEKEPRIETSRIERRRYPTTDKSKIISVEIQLVMLQQRGPRHASRFEIVEQRNSLTFRQRLAAARNQHAQLFKQLARSAADHRGRFRIRRVSDVDFSVVGVDLSARKRMKAAQKREFIAALDPENFRIRPDRCLAGEGLSRPRLWECLLVVLTLLLTTSGIARRRRDPRARRACDNRPLPRSPLDRVSRKRTPFTHFADFHA